MNIRKSSNSRIASCSIYLDGMSEPALDESSNGVYIGKTMVYSNPFSLDLDRLVNKNIAILGMSGSGKSYFLKSFIMRSNLKRDSKILIIDWNNEYNDVVKFLDGTILSLGSNFNINIMDLYDMNDTSNIRKVSDIISSILNLDKDDAYAIYNRMSKAFMTHGNKLNLNKFIESLIGDEDRLAQVLGSRLLGLKGNPMFSNETNFRMHEMLNGVISIDFSGLKDDTQRDEISRSILKIIVEIMHSFGINQNTKNTEKIIVLDETWRLIKNSGDVGVLFREGRKYGFCVAIATQLVSDINNEIISNSAAFFLFRLQNENDYRMLIDSGLISEEDRYSIAELSTGSCMASIALSSNKNVINRFFINHIDGVNTKTYAIKSDKMQRRISYKNFNESMKVLLAGSEIEDRITRFFAENNNQVECPSLIIFMLELGIKRPEIVHYLRRLGLNDMEIVNAYYQTSKIPSK